MWRGHKLSKAQVDGRKIFRESYEKVLTMYSGGYTIEPDRVKGVSKMTVEQMITKYRIALTDDGNLRLASKPTAADVDYIKANKPAIVAELRRRAQERAAAEAAKEAAIIEAQRPLRRLALCRWGGWDTVAEYQICYVVPDDGEGYADWYKNANPHLVARESEAVIVDGKAVEAYTNRKPDGVLPQDGVLWFISEADKAAIIEGVERKAAEEQARKEAEEVEKQAKVEQALAEAKATGKPVEIARWTEPCDGTVRECSLDIVTRWAMPDGTIKVRRTHTY